MLLQSIIQLNEDKELPGTYVGVRLSYESIEKITKLIEKLKIPNPLPESEYHLTVVYSTKHLKDFEPKGVLKDPIVITPTHFSIFKSQEGNNVLVIEVESEELSKRHEYILEKFKGTHNFKDFKPHLSLSYDASDKLPSNKLLETLGDLEIAEEYSEDLRESKATK